MRKIGLLVMSFGTPSKPEEIEAYYTRIRHGHAPSEAQLAELTGRFQKIGGTSPLIEKTQAQAAELLKQANALSSDLEFKLYLGYQYVVPFIGDVVQQMYAEGIREVVAVAMAPHYSKYSVQAYHNLAHDAAKDFEDMTFIDIIEWWKEPGFSETWANNIRAELARIPADEQDKSIVIFSAHSLPEKILASGDPYAEQVRESAEQIAQKAQLGHYTKAWQSAGRTGDKWLGPDVLDVTRELVENSDYKHFIYCPIGFVIEHLEVLSDNDIECQELCAELGVTYHRPPMPNADSLFISSISAIIAKKLGL